MSIYKKLLSVILTATMVVALMAPSSRMVSRAGTDTGTDTDTDTGTAGHITTTATTKTYTYDFEGADAPAMTVVSRTKGTDVSGFQIVEEPSDASDDTSVLEAKNHVYQVSNQGIDNYMGTSAAYPADLPADSLKKSMQVDIYVGELGKSAYFQAIGLSFTDINNYRAFAYCYNISGYYDPKASYFADGENKNSDGGWWWGDNGLKTKDRAEDVIKAFNEATWLTFRAEYSEDGTTISWWNKDDESRKLSNTIGSSNEDLKDLRKGVVALFSGYTTVYYDNLQIEYCLSDEEIVANYNETYRNIIEKQTDDVTADDTTAVCNAINAYNALSDGAKESLETKCPCITEKLSALKAAAQKAYWLTPGQNNYTVTYDFETTTNMIVEGENTAGFEIVEDPTDATNHVYQVGTTTKSSSDTAAYPFDVSSDKNKKSMQVDIYVGRFPYQAAEKFNLLGLSYTDIKNYRAFGYCRYDNGTDKYNPKGYRVVSGSDSASWFNGDNSLKMNASDDYEWITFRAEYSETGTSISWWVKGCKNESEKYRSATLTNADDADLRKGFVALFNAANGTICYDNLVIEYAQDAADEANSFQTEYDDVLKLTSETVTKENSARVFRAAAELDNMSDAAREIVGSTNIALVESLKAKVSQLVVADAAQDSVIEDNFADASLSEALWNNYRTLKISGSADAGYKIAGQKDVNMPVYANTAYGENQVLSSVSFTAKLVGKRGIGTDDAFFLYPVYAKKGEQTVRDVISLSIQENGIFYLASSRGDFSATTDSCDEDNSGNKVVRGVNINVNGFERSGQYQGVTSAEAYVGRTMRVTLNYDWSAYTAENPKVTWYIRVEIESQDKPVVLYEGATTTVGVTEYDVGDFTFGFCSPKAELSDFRIVYSTVSEAQTAANFANDLAVRTLFEMDPATVVPYDETRIAYAKELLGGITDTNILPAEKAKIEALENALAEWNTEDNEANEKTEDQKIADRFKVIRAALNNDRKALNIYNRLTKAQKNLLTEEYSKMLSGLGSDATDDTTINISCIGDSITEGCGGAPQVSGHWTNGWVVHMTNALGEGYAVKNYGIGGTSIRTPQSPGIWMRSRFYREALYNDSDIYIIMLGTNDQDFMREAIAKGTTEAANAKAEIREKLLDLVQSVLSNQSNPTVVLATICRDGRGADPENSAKSVISGIIREIADDYGLPLVDINALTKSWDNYKDLFAEWLHPNVEGHALIASHMTSFILGAEKTVNNENASIFDFTQSERNVITAPKALGATVATDNVSRIKFGFDFNQCLSYADSAELTITEYGAYVVAGNYGTSKAITDAYKTEGTKVVKKTRTDIEALRASAATENANAGVYSIVINNSDTLANIAKPVSAVAYIKLGDGTEIYSDAVVTSSMRIIKRVYKNTIVPYYDAKWDKEDSSIAGTALEAAFTAYAEESVTEEALGLEEDEKVTFTYDILKTKMEIASATTTKSERAAMKWILAYVMQHPENPTTDPE